MTSKIHITNYSPFGVLLQNRNFTGEKYRYGFLGQEMDDEVKENGNSYDFVARLYCPRTGRWLTPDPKTATQPGWSPYKSFNNNPIIFVDPDGEKEYLKIVMEDKDGNTVVFRKQTSMDIMTDGVKHTVPGWNPFGGPTATWSYENNYYDFERVITMTQNADGTITSTESLNILTNGPVRDRDYVWGSGAKYGDSKLDWSEWWSCGSSQPSGFNLVSADGGASPTNTKATKGGVVTIDIGPFLTALGGLGRTPGKLPSIKDALGPAELINNLSELKQSGQKVIDEWNNKSSNATFECTNPGCNYETNDSIKSSKEQPLHNLKRKTD
jgi:RHS repeat-associated protein